MENIQNITAPRDSLTVSATFVEILNTLAKTQPDDTALIFLQDGETELPPITYRELKRQAEAFAKGLQTVAKPNDRVILLFQSSYEFAIAFLGCMYAGVISIPLPIPGRRQSEWTRMERIINNSDAKAVVAVDKVLARLEKNQNQYYDHPLSQYCSYELLVSVNTDNMHFSPEKITLDDIAFLQYTSGSTGDPKGVTLTHRNLIENQVILKKGFRNESKSVYLSWLPLFHDMGLIGNFLQAIYIGQPFIFMAPNAFLQKPIRWLKAIEKYQVRVSGAPNFAYQLCVDRITEEERQNLDLSCWEVAFNGAEPVRASTLEQFCQTFSISGFDQHAWYPCYGTAESTLIISGATQSQAPVVINVEREQYEEGQIQVTDSAAVDSIALVASGEPLIEHSVVIVDSETRTVLNDDCVGEIWLTSPCNAIGYWANESASKDAFHNRLHDAQNSSDYLNTGDLGFLHRGNLFITGRSKDLLIFNGRNIYPQDIEACSEQSHSALKHGRCAATSLFLDHKERLVLVHEVERSHTRQTCYDDVFDAIRVAVYKEFAIPVHAIALVAPSTVPMTSSGKIRRQTCRRQFQENTLNLIASWTEA